MNKTLRGAMTGGRRIAGEVIAFRTEQRRKRTMTKSMELVESIGTQTGPKIPAKTRAMLGPKSNSGVLIAEGDSWFDYPMHDVLQVLEDDYFFDVESVAHKGDCVEDMAHSKGQFEEFARRLEKLLRDGKVPRAILLSGGGNDIVGDEFAILLNHAASSLPPLNEDIVRGVIDVRLQAAFGTIITSLTAIARSYLERPIPIITHGYDYPVPDGRGFLGGWWILPGPWMRPGFHRKGYGDLEKNTQVVVKLIDRFNLMLATLSSHPQFSHVHYVDLRGTLKKDSTYKKYWDNELHPSERGFDLVAEKFVNEIQSV